MSTPVQAKVIYSVVLHPGWAPASQGGGGWVKMWVLGQLSPLLHTYTTGGNIWWLEVLVSGYGQWP